MRADPAQDTARLEAAAEEWLSTRARLAGSELRLVQTARAFFNEKVSGPLLALLPEQEYRQLSEALAKAWVVTPIFARNSIKQCIDAVIEQLDRHAAPDDVDGARAEAAIQLLQEWLAVLELCSVRLQ